MTRYEVYAGVKSSSSERNLPWREQWRGVLVTRQETGLFVLQKRGAQIRWESPSGLVENGKTFEDAAVRNGGVTLERVGVGYCAAACGQIEARPETS